ncbi:MAG: PstS family phosphate ABC transporter substrate-binding protein [Planctomycetes bacterium]|nr:PstS family phosphate ABC transporter substrate-binding protein [Planctomycetota bacterium]MBI3835741.1 PstS family phosphate ABC transporter substrate-binding protein [Planctomycetota bacterium]
MREIVFETRCSAIVSTLFFCSGLASAADVAGTVKIDGSSTVAPISMAAAELFQAKNKAVKVTVGISGTGGGFKKFLDAQAELRTDISDASRPIEATELKKAEEHGVKFMELPLAWDGICVVVHPSNSFCNHLTVEELKRIWSPDSKINNWKDIRGGFPDLPLKLYGPGTDSGTFDYFTQAIVGKEKSSRADYTPSENDNVLVQGVAGDRGSLGYFGYAYYEANKSKLKAIAIDSGDGKPVTPSVASIRDGSYKPLSRPLFLYVNAASWKRPEVKAFVEFVFADPKSIVEHKRVNYVSLPDAVYDLARQRLKEEKTGSAMAKAPAGLRDLAAIFSAP